MEMLPDIATLSRERAPTHRGASIVPSYKVLYMSSICPTANDSNQRTIGTSHFIVCRCVNHGWGKWHESRKHFFPMQMHIYLYMYAGAMPIYVASAGGAVGHPSLLFEAAGNQLRTGSDGLVISSQTAKGMGHRPWMDA